ncbi:MAG: GNAT family N-acetyltransferase [Treponema sp.]|nr:GNAT family N-acetyltransferase [Treponema sp.]
MSFYPLRYLPSGHIFIDTRDDCDRVVDTMLATGYSEEFCLARDFDEGFAGRLMEAGFLVMSTEIRDYEEHEHTQPPPARFFVLLPKLHLVRSVLFFHELRIKKSVRRFLPLYELRVNTNFERILDKCVEIHGTDWLTPPLVEILKTLRRNTGSPRQITRAAPVSFAVYRDGELKAGEIGVVMGRVYSSYSGYHEEDNAGTVQMILMVQWLKEAGFDFLDMGMPLDYKTALGARDVSPGKFVELFRAARVGPTLT